MTTVDVDVTPVVVNWTGADNNNEWDDGNNWSTGSVPGLNDVALIGQQFSGITILHDDSMSDSVYRIQSQAALVLSGGALSIASTSTIDNSLTLMGATLGGSGDLTLNGQFIWQGATLQGVDGEGSLTAELGMTLGVSGGSYLTLDGYTLVNPQGPTANLQTANLQTYIVLDPGSGFKNDGTLDLGSAAGVVSGGNTTIYGTFTNNGTVVEAGGSCQFYAGQNNNYGTINLQTGTMQLGYGGSQWLIAGTITAATTTELDLSGISFTQAADATLTADKVVFGFAVSGSNFDVAGQYSASATSVGGYLNSVTLSGEVQSLGSLSIGFDAGTLNLSQATLAPAATTLPSLDLEGNLVANTDLTVSGPLQWLYGTLSSGGSITPYTLTGNTGMTLGVSGGSYLTLDGYTLVNPQGPTANLQTYIVLDPGSGFENDGTLDLGSAAGVVSGGNTTIYGTFTNNGTVVEAGGSCQFYAGQNNNYGTINLQAGGTMQLGYGGSQWLNAGTITAAAGTVLDIGGSLVTLGPTSSITAYSLVLVPATLNVQRSGPSPGVGFSSITVGNSAAIGGKLNLQLLSGFAPFLGETLTLVGPTRNATVEATFTNGPTLGAPGVEANGWTYTTLFGLQVNNDSNLNYNDVELTSEGSLIAAPDQSEVTTTAVQAATNTGTFTSPAGAVTWSASLGTVVTTGAGTWSWSWSYTPTSGPMATQTVTMTATDPDGNVATTTFAFNITQATPTIAWTTPTDIPYGTALSSGQLDATASVPGTFVYTPAAGTVLGAGNQQALSVTFTPTDATDYTNATDTVYINVDPAPPTISWATPNNIAYGTALSSTQLDASASVAGSFTYTPAAGTVLGAGTKTLSVTFTPTDSVDYASASSTVTVNVVQGTPTVVSVNPVNITYGTALANGQLGGSASWTVNGSSVTVPGTFTYTSAAGTVLGAGNGQSEAVTFTPTVTTDYTSASSTVTVNVVQGTPTVVSVNPVNITYGTALANGQLSGSASWIVNGSTVTVPGSFTYTSAAGSVLNAFASGQSEAVTFTPTDTTDYTTASATVTVNVAQATVTTQPTTATTAYSTSAQVLTLVGNVTSNSSAPVNGGTFTFTVAGFSPVTSGTVTNGTASASFTLPAGEAPRTFTDHHCLQRQR